MFTTEDRDRVRALLLARAEADPEVTGAALTGSMAEGAEDRWSDTDLVLAVRGRPAAVAERWTDWLTGDLGALHHWDFSNHASVIRVFLLPGWVELDLTFAPEEQFGARGPQWRTLFGDPRELEQFPPPDRNRLTGLLWHHALHARTCIRRGRLWQAEYWISAIRDQLTTLACVRLGLPAAHAKGAHLLPRPLASALAEALVRELTEAELHRALCAAVAATEAELALTEPELARRLGPEFADLLR